MGAEGTRTPAASGAQEDRKSLWWASLLTGLPELQAGTMGQARQRLLEWWKYSVERISRQIPELPEDFRTTRIWRQIKFVENYCLRLRPVFDDLQAGTCSTNESMGQLRHVFSDEENRLRKWKTALDNLQGLILWLPAFSHAREYLLAAFPLGMEGPDTLCRDLIRSIRDPYSFLEAGTRERFDEDFLEFKKRYIENYSILHEAMLNAVQDAQKEESRVDPVALRNLELLSGLPYTDKSHLNRVRILARWIKGNQCTLPASRILELYPRCYCNFNPGSIRHPSKPVHQLNGVIQEGIEYFRTVLAQCRDMISAETDGKNPGKDVSGQIDAFVRDGATIPLQVETIEALNRIIRKNPACFHAMIRSRTAQGPSGEADVQNTP